MNLIAMSVSVLSLQFQRKKSEPVLVDIGLHQQELFKHYFEEMSEVISKALCKYQKPDSYG